MKQPKDVLGDLLCICEQVFPEQKEQIEEKSRALFIEYCKAEEGKPEEITMHTVKKILPCIAFYQAAGEYTNQKEKVYALIEEYFAKNSQVVAKKLRKICGLPFVYKLVPRVMANIIHKSFGVKSGFEMTDRNVKGKLCHIDMMRCPYFSACSLHGCPELTTAFCNSDDIAYGNMHPRLSWERSKTLGRGDDRCDFILRIK